MKKLLKQSKIPVLIISGDRHQGAIYEEDNLFEIIKNEIIDDCNLAKQIKKLI